MTVYEDNAGTKRLLPPGARVEDFITRGHLLGTATRVVTASAATPAPNHPAGSAPVPEKKTAAQLFNELDGEAPARLWHERQPDAG